MFKYLKINNFVMNYKKIIVILLILLIVQNVNAELPNVILDAQLNDKNIVLTWDYTPISCLPNWGNCNNPEYGWSICLNGMRTRVCKDLNQCNQDHSLNEKIEKRTCAKFTAETTDASESNPDENTNIDAAAVKNTLTGNSVFSKVTNSFANIGNFFKKLFGFGAVGTNIVYKFEIYRNIVKIDEGDPTKYCDLNNNCKYEDKNLAPGRYDYFVRIVSGSETKDSNIKKLTILSFCSPNTCKEENSAEICNSEGSAYVLCSSIDSTKPICRNKLCTSQSINPTCTPSWQCGLWSSCINNEQTRTCTDSNNCGVDTNKPSTTQACSATCTNGQIQTETACLVCNNNVYSPDNTKCASGQTCSAEGQCTVPISQQNKVEDNVPIEFLLPLNNSNLTINQTFFLVNTTIVNGEVEVRNLINGEISVAIKNESGLYNGVISLKLGKNILKAVARNSTNEFLTAINVYLIEIPEIIPEPSPNLICLDSDEDGFKQKLCGGTDCNDNDSDINPNMTEICDDDLDNDCNNLIDLRDPSCITNQTTTETNEQVTQTTANEENEEEISKETENKNKNGEELDVTGKTIVDEDKDGLPDDWEKQYFGDLKQGPNDDYDNDGLTNIQEYSKNKNPKVADAKTGDILTGLIIFIIVTGIIGTPITLFVKKLKKKKLIKIESQFTKPEQKQIYEYIIKARSRKVNDEDIKNILVNAGWLKEEIEYVMKIK